MKIGILTLPLHTNYGGILQAYALQSVLEGMGNEVYIIERKKEKYTILNLIKKSLKKVLLYLHIKNETSYEKELAVYKYNAQSFIKEHIKIIYLKSFSDILELKFEAVVVGSDQIWRPLYCKNIENAYLDFLGDNNIIRIAYAVSFGTDIWEYTDEQTSVCRELVKKFRVVSVREDSGLKLCHNYLGIDAIKTLDPTLLLSIVNYEKLFPKIMGENRSYIFVYVLTMSEDKKHALELITEKMGLPHRFVYSFINPNINDLPNDCVVAKSVEEWLYYLSKANFVFTDSFHACVFSLIFNKEFIAYGNESGGISRFESLLQMVNLKDRLIFCSNDVKDNISSIDYNRVNSVIENNKSKSLKFLSENLA